MYAMLYNTMALSWLRVQAPQKRQYKLSTLKQPFTFTAADAQSFTAVMWSPWSAQQTGEVRCSCGPGLKLNEWVLGLGIDPNFLESCCGTEPVLLSAEEQGAEPQAAERCFGSSWSGVCFGLCRVHWHRVGREGAGAGRRSRAGACAGCPGCWRHCQGLHRSLEQAKEAAKCM